MDVDRTLAAKSCRSIAAMIPTWSAFSSILFSSLSTMRGTISRWVVISGWTAVTFVTARGQSLIQTYCVGCHNQKVKTAGVALDNAD